MTEMMGTSPYDVIIVYTSVHGGSFHKLLHLQQQLREIDLKSRVILNCDPPLGLQIGLDVEHEQVHHLTEEDIHVLGVEEIVRAVEATPARLFMFDAAKHALIGRLASIAAHQHNAKTAQFGTLFDDFCYWDTDYVFLQHPTTLWFILEQRHRKDARRLTRAKRIFFAGNIFYEPVCNTWTSDISSREQLFAKYGFDPSLPLCLWLPNRADGMRLTYKAVIEAVRSVPMTLAVKLHPWEYKNLKHGFDPRYGLGTTSADRWGLPAIDEKDSTWALRFCDVAVVAGSTVGIEIPCWHKPLIYVSPKNWRTDIVESCSLRLDDVDDLGSVLERCYPLTFSSADYDRARSYIFPAGGRDSFQLHLDHIQEALAAPPDQPDIGQLRQITRLYAGTVPMTKTWRGGPARRVVSYLQSQFPRASDSVIWRKLRQAYRRTLKKRSE
jgi:hypothetical protein